MQLLFETFRIQIKYEVKKEKKNNFATRLIEDLD
jgi:hypothetical protein